MNHTVDTEQMNALKVLADTNLKISEAKNALFKMREDETTYLVAREKKALDRIQRVLDESEALIKQTKTNYSELNDLFKSASQLSDFIIEAQGNFKKMLADFDERSVVWEAKVAEKEEEIAEARKKLQIDTVTIANEKKNIAKANAKIVEDNRKITDAWGEIERELNRLKEK